MRRISNLALLSIFCTVFSVAAFAQDSVARAEQNVAELKKLDAVLTFLRKRNALDYAITTPNGIDEGKYVTIGGIEQWITIRGEDRSNPVLLFLHGALATPQIRGPTPHFARGSGSSLSFNGISVVPARRWERMDLR